MILKILDEKGQAVGDLGFNEPQEIPSERLVLEVLYLLAKKGLKSQAQVKTRGAVRGGGRKPWRQKGTGRARQGSIRSPLWRGGGVSHGPVALRREIKLNEEARRKATAAIFLQKVLAGQVKVLKGFPVSGKSRLFSGFLNNLGLTDEKILAVTEDKLVVRSARNLPRVRIASAKTLGLPELLSAEVLILSEGDFKLLAERWAL